MLLTLTTTYEPATDLGFLLHKHPKKLQTFQLTFGRAHVFYPQATPTQCSAALLVDIELPVNGSLPEPNDLRYPLLHDRAYRASALLSSAIAQVYGAALQGYSPQRPQLVDCKLPLQAQIALICCVEAQQWLPLLFQPLGYQVMVYPHSETQPYCLLKLQAQCSLQSLLTHLYGLMPVLAPNPVDEVGSAALNAIWQQCQEWLTQHPQRAFIEQRYSPQSTFTQTVESPTHSLNLGDLKVISTLLKNHSARRVIDFYQHRQFVELILKDKFFKKIVAVELLTAAQQQLNNEKLPIWQKKRLQTFKIDNFKPDKQRYAYETATVLNLFEHLSEQQCQNLIELLFKAMKPKIIIITSQKTASIPFCQTFPTWSQELAQQFHYTLSHTEHHLSVQLSIFTQC